MKNVAALFFVFGVLGILVVPARSAILPGAVASAPMPFVEHTGRISDGDIRFSARTIIGAVHVTADGELIYVLPSPMPDGRPDVANEQVVVREIFIDAHGFELRGDLPSAAKIHFFRGSDPAQWDLNVAAYDAVQWRGLYAGIEMAVRVRGRTIEKIFTLAPGAEARDIVVELDGVCQLLVDETGGLVARLPKGAMAFSTPAAWQDGPGGREAVDVNYWIEGSRYGFELGDYDETRALFIDPLLGGTYLGGHKWDSALAMTVSADGRVYVAGFTGSSDFPVTPHAFQTNRYGIFVSLFDNCLTNLIASAVIGGSHSETAYDIITDNAGQVYVVGATSSSDFPTTPGAYRRILGSPETNDAFIAILSADLSRLLAATLLGGNEMDGAETIALDAWTNVYVAGYTRSTNYPVHPEAFQKTLKGWGDGFIAKFNSGLNQLLASTYCGGSNFDQINSLKLDSVGAVYVTGITGGNGFPTTNLPYSSVFGGGTHDGFVAKFDGVLHNLLNSTYLGGLGDEWPNAILVAGNRIYVAGSTWSSNFPTVPGSFQTLFQGGTNDGFVSEFDAGLHQLGSSTLLGGTEFDFIQDMARGTDGSICVAGYTSSSNFPTTVRAYNKELRNLDAFVARLNANLSELGASTLLGGSWDDYGQALALDHGGNVFVAGYVESPDFPTAPDAYERVYHWPALPWHGDGFVAKLDHTLMDFPAPPTRVTTSFKTYPDRIRVAWHAADHADEYVVRRGSDANPFSAIVVTNLPDDVTAYCDYGVLPGRAYYYWLTAVNASGGSAFSDVAVGARSPVCALAADFDGDGRADPVIVSNGLWYVWLSSTGYRKIGPAIGAAPGSMSVAADFDGDGQADPAAVDADGKWKIWFSQSGYMPIGPVPLAIASAGAVAADFDGDSLGDPGLVSGAQWHLWLSSAGFQPSPALVYGSAEMIPLAADFDGDRFADFANYLDRAWTFWLSGSAYRLLGPSCLDLPDGLPVAADFDGDRLSDVAVYWSATGEWFFLLSGNNYRPTGAVRLPL